MKKSLLFFAAALACSACDFPDAIPLVFGTNTTALYISNGDTEGSYILSGNITLASSYNWNMQNSAPDYITIGSNNQGSGGAHFFRPQLTDALKALLAEPDKHFTQVAGSGYLIAQLRFSAPSYAGGSCSVNIYYSPFIRFISTKEELAAINNDEKSLSRHYKLMADIDLKGKEWMPIGSAEEGKHFTGSFDGNGHRISNLKISLPDRHAGLFGWIEIEGDDDIIVVQNLQLVNVEIEAKYAGAVAGYLHGIIRGCSVTGTGNIIGGGHTAGGIVGQCGGSGSIQNCSATATVSATGNAGGIVGGAGTHSILNCYAAGAVHVTGTQGQWADAGGIAGVSNNHCHILNCYATATVSATGYHCHVGGILGHSAQSTIQNCYATGAVSADRSSEAYVGGITGYSSQNIIQNCYATGAVSADGSSAAYAGGITGYSSSSSIQDCVTLNSNISSSSDNLHRVVGDRTSGTLNYNYGWEGMWKNGGTPTWTSHLTGEDGENIGTSKYKSESWWNSISGIWTSVWGGTDDNYPWVWDSANSRPKLYWQ